MGLEAAVEIVAAHCGDCQREAHGLYLPGDDFPTIFPILTFESDVRRLSAEYSTCPYCDGTMLLATEPRGELEREED